MNQINRLMGFASVITARAVGRSTHIADVKAGRWTPPVRASAGILAWPTSEVEAQLAARISGKSEIEIMELVRTLAAARTAKLPRAL